MRTTEMHVAPSHWASYLINGDSSGLSAGDIAQCALWREENELGDAIDIGEPYIGRWSGLICELADYTFQRQ